MMGDAQTLFGPGSQASEPLPAVGDPVEALQGAAAEASHCVRCGLSEARTQVVFGVGDPQAELMLVGEGPGADEDATGEPFVGRSGKLLTKLLAEAAGLAREQVYITNVVKCRPPGNRDPKPEEILACSKFLNWQLQLVAPKVIVSLGNPATRTLLNTTVGITKLRGTEHEFAFPGGTATLLPTFHPSAALRNPANLPLLSQDLAAAKQLLG